MSDTILTFLPYLACFLLVCFFAWYEISCYRARKKILNVQVKTSDKDYDEKEDIHGNIIVKSFLYAHSALRDKLEHVNQYDPKKRTQDLWDVWFRNNTKNLCHDGACLDHINRLGHIGDTFFKNIERLNVDVAHDLEFQRLLISVSYNAYARTYYTNFNNLLFVYAEHYDFLPEILEVLNTDERFAHAKEVYERGHQYK
ncbi:MAG: hypothetical protein J5896_00480 [Alphaproteobacteria bacterium]|nr:hypothetical protein [Alphaproteobacteria bacterium]